MKTGCDVHGVLPGHRIHDQHGVARLDRRLHALELAHQLVIDVQAPGGVDQHGVVAAIRSFANGVLRDRDRVIAGLGGVNRHVDLARQCRELLDRCGAIDVGGNQIGAAPTHLLEVQRELAGGRGFSRTVQADQHDRHRRRCGEVDLDRLRPHQLGELGADDLDEVLLRSEARQDFLAERLGPNPLAEISHDVDVYVGLEKG